MAATAGSGEEKIIHSFPHAADNGELLSAMIYVGILGGGNISETHAAQALEDVRVAAESKLMANHLVADAKDLASTLCEPSINHRAQVRQ